MQKQQLQTWLILGLVVWLLIGGGAAARAEGEVHEIPKDPFFAWVFSWGQAIQPVLPKGWRMRWEPSTLRTIGWSLGLQRGYRLIFEHEVERVHLPIPHPMEAAPGSRLQLKRKMCSLHLYPRHGTYHAYESPLVFPRPAALWAISKEAVFFLPERFAAQEFPCPEVLAPLRRSLHLGKIRVWSVSSLRDSLDVSEKIAASTTAHAAFLTLRGEKKPSLPFALLMKHAGRQSLCIEFRSAHAREWQIVHDPKLRMPLPLPSTTSPQKRPFLRSFKGPRPRPRPRSFSKTPLSPQTPLRQDKDAKLSP